MKTTPGHIRISDAMWERLHPRPTDDILEEIEDDLRLMTVGELREMIASLPANDYITVNGYEGGLDIPHLERHGITAVKAFADCHSYCGPWTSGKDYGEPTVADVWVLAREGR